MLAGGYEDGWFPDVPTCLDINKYLFDLDGDGNKEAKIVQNQCRKSVVTEPEDTYYLIILEKNGEKFYFQPQSSPYGHSILLFSPNYSDSRTPLRFLKTAPVEKVLCRGNPCQIPQYEVGDVIKLPMGEMARIYGPAYKINVTNGVLIDSVVYYVLGHEYIPINPPISLSKVEPVSTRMDLEKRGDKIIAELERKHPKEMKDWKYFSTLVQGFYHLREPYQTQATNAERVLGAGLLALVENTVPDTFGRTLLLNRIRKTLPLPDEAIGAMAAR